MNKKHLAFLMVAIALLCVVIATNTSLVFDSSDITKHTAEEHAAVLPSFSAASGPQNHEGVR